MQTTQTQENVFPCSFFEGETLAGAFKSRSAVLCRQIGRARNAASTKKRGPIVSVDFTEDFREPSSQFCMPSRLGVIPHPRANTCEENLRSLQARRSQL